MKKLYPLLLALIIMGCQGPQVEGEGETAIVIVARETTTTSTTTTTTLPILLADVEGYDWVIEEAPQLTMRGHNNWDSPSFTITYPPWMIELEGVDRIVIHRDNGTRLARQLVTNDRFAIAEAGTFWLEIHAYGPWYIWITEGALEF